MNDPSVPPFPPPPHPPHHVQATGSWEDWETDPDSGSNRQQQEKVIPGIGQDYQLQ